MRRSRVLALLVPLAALVTACGPGASAAPTTTFTAPTDPPSQAPSEAPSDGPTEGATVEAAEVGTVGTVLIAGENQMTLYIFTKDVRDSGESVCTGDCIDAWPALTVPAGSEPSAGEGVDAAKLGTITRSDDGSLQVTYDGLPLYFFVGDQAPGDTTGIYEFWEVVAP
ncbi:MAG TPA: hypothetical protein VFX65_14100 [Candidatus Limnocylindrales bacterium]|nr:hypothetical protein [Candidatus Limnocylindrales bacterium]